MNFQYFLRRGSALKFPLTTEHYACKSVPGVKGIKRVIVIESKMGQQGRKSKCTTFYRDSNQSIIYKDCNRIKGSFD